MVIYCAFLYIALPKCIQHIYEEANDKGYNDVNNDYLHIWFNQ